MKINRRFNRKRRGFLLLEVILALMVFSIAATGFAVALRRTADLAVLSQKKVKITRILESALIAAMSMPTMTEGVTTDVVDEMKEFSMEIDTEVKALPDLQNQDGQPLQNMYRVTVTAHRTESGQEQVQDATTWRYGLLYQPQ